MRVLVSLWPVVVQKGRGEALELYLRFYGWLWGEGALVSMVALGRGSLIAVAYLVEE